VNDGSVCVYVCMMMDGYIYHNRRRKEEEVGNK